jgi:hypothetical protein
MVYPASKDIRQGGSLPDSFHTCSPKEITALCFDKNNTYGLPFITMDLPDTISAMERFIISRLPRDYLTILSGLLSHEQ